MTSVTALAIDGNSLLAASVRRGEGEYIVSDLRTRELPRLVERICRINHPIFMDVDRLEFEEETVSLLSKLLGEINNDDPVIGVLPADSVRHYREWSESGETGGADARLSRLVEQGQLANPYAYPRLYGFKNHDSEGEREKTTLWSCQFEDLLAAARQYRRAGARFLGLASGLRALAEIGLLLGGTLRDEPLTLVDAGKLRTSFLGMLHGEVLFSHVIPVGLARSDMNYFSSFPPVLSEVEELKNQYGSLFLPADITPSALGTSAQTPQTEITKLCAHIAQFAHRVNHSVWPKDMGVEQPARVLVAGLSARVPGMLAAASERAGIPLAPLSSSRIPGLRLETGGGWVELADHLVPVGAAIAWLRREQSRFGLFLRDRRPVHVPRALPLEQKWCEDELYVVEAPPGSQSSIVRRLSAPGV